MAKKCIKFISGFLIPNLNSEKFGEYLKWIDKRKKTFQIVWHHKGGQAWTTQEAEVFTEWDKHKGHFQPEDKEYYTKSKQRFRSLLYKLTLDGHLENLKCDDKFKKVYCIIRKKHYKRGKKNNEFTAESEHSHESFSSFDEDDGDLHLDDIYRRKISENDAVNVLEDHPYSSAYTLQDRDTGHECCRDLHTDVTTTLYESSEYLEKRVLVEKNNMHDEYFNSLVPNNMYDLQIPEDFLMTGDLYTENTNLSKFSENMQIDQWFISTSYKNSEKIGSFIDNPGFIEN